MVKDQRDGAEGVRVERWTVQGQVEQVGKGFGQRRCADQRSSAVIARTIARVVMSARNRTVIVAVMLRVLAIRRRSRSVCHRVAVIIVVGQRTLAQAVDARYEHDCGGETGHGLTPKS